MSPFPPLRPWAVADLPAPTGEEAAAFDAWAIDQVGVPGAVLMENAGRSAAQVARRLWPEGPVVGLVGGGNNGGDALVLLRTLAAWGRPVTAVRVADRPDDALSHGWDLPTVHDHDLDDRGWRDILGGAAVVVDGVLGTGIRGAPRDRQAAAIRRVNQAARPVLALDLPSGVDSATGAVPGDAVQADVTVAFGAPKRGGLLHPGRARVGRLLAVEIGFPPADPERDWARVVTPAWAQTRLPERSSDTHKNAVGRVVVVAGRTGMAGAAVLAVRATLRAGAGLVQVASPAGNRVVLQSAVPEAIFVDANDPEALDAALRGADAVAVGPGLGTDEAAAGALARVLATGDAPLVVDADGLNLLAAGRAPAFPETTRRRPVLLTPHPGEMARLRPAADGTDRVAAVRDAARAFDCAVILKGAPSLAADPEGPVRIDGVGSSDLAVAGMGDVLTGVCAGLLAQGVAVADAGPVGLYLSGRAAVLSGRGRGLTPLDVVRHLPDALAERGAGHTDLDLPFLLFDQDAAR